MSDYSSRPDMSVTAEVVSKRAVDVGTQVRKSFYKFDLFEPIALPELKKILGTQVFDGFKDRIEKLTIPYHGDFRVPLAELMKDIGYFLSQEMISALFSKPLWSEYAPNIVTNVGLSDSLDKHFKGSAYTAAWYVGLSSGTPTFAAGDTMASHAGWVEVAPYSGARPTLTLGAVTTGVTGSVDNSASKASYTITANMVVGGAFVVTLPTASQTSGTIYGGAAFNGGNRTVSSGDTLNVTINLTAVSG